VRQAFFDEQLDRGAHAARALDHAAFRRQECHVACGGLGDRSRAVGRADHQHRCARSAFRELCELRDTAILCSVTCE
jgi:hypothetical protein